MKRIQFITKLFGLLGAGWLIPSRYSDSPKSEALPIYEGWIAGYIYYDRPVIINELHVGQSLKLHREPTNAYDKNAIEIYSEGHKLGYISQMDNSVLAALMDHGEWLEARIVKLHDKGSSWNRIKISIQKRITQPSKACQVSKT